jgi:hypothetical protein
LSAFFFAERGNPACSFGSKNFIGKDVQCHRDQQDGRIARHPAN